MTLLAALSVKSANNGFSVNSLSSDSKLFFYYLVIFSSSSISLYCETSNSRAVNLVYNCSEFRFSSLRLTVNSVTRALV